MCRRGGVAGAPPRTEDVAGGSGADGRSRPFPDADWPRPVKMVKTVPLGQIVTVGHCLANPQCTNWLAEIVTVTESPGVSVP